jgi:hypothetical protein
MREDYICTREELAATIKWKRRWVVVQEVNGTSLRQLPIVNSYN